MLRWQLLERTWRKARAVFGSGSSRLYRQVRGELSVPCGFRRFHAYPNVPMIRGPRVSEYQDIPQAFTVQPIPALQVLETEGRERGVLYVIYAPGIN
jgi:hypothetical protein